MRMPTFRDIGRAGTGNVVLIFALIAPLLLGFAGAALDFGRHAVLRAELQEVADAAAIAGAREFLLASSSAVVARGSAERTARASLARMREGADVALSISADEAAQSVTADLSLKLRPTFLVKLTRRLATAGATATAQATGGVDICVLGLNRIDADVLLLDDRAALEAPKCGVYANSADPHGLLVKGAALLKSGFNCTAGGYGDSDLAFAPTPVTDCPPRADPLSARVAPTAVGCDHQNLSLIDHVGRLAPGVYCGGLTIDGSSKINLDPGIFVMKDGPLQIKDKTRLSGEGVGFYFVGADARLLFEDKAVISLAAPVEGAMAGILFWQSPTATGRDRFEVKSNFVDRLVGTIYLPSAEFFAFASDEIAEDSEYTVIIADRIHLTGRTTLVLNSNYALTPVPPPMGLAGVGKQVVLRD